MYPTHSPKLPRRSDQNYVGQTQPSSRSSPVTLPRASKMASPGRARKAQQQRGVDNNGAALTLENLQSVNAAYSQTFLTEGRERAPSPPRPANLSARSASLTNVRGRSWDRGDAYDYAPAPHAGERYPPLQRGRSLERAEYGGGLRGNERWYLDPHDYDIERPHSQASSYSDRYAYRDGGGAQQLNSQLILDLQAQICDLQRECSGLHQDLDQSNQKLSSSMNSIKTFWSPELKKERAMRKEENLKYAMQQEQLRLSMHENE
ncbi:PREDICTED: ERC protein 2-like, partial [Priapulus caudatus]|uniref:ERC protein 2-like n=1 Tax=Priapulus caudatus TaxID=37621 RepID=A0ABM1EWQ2_PRICU